MWYDTDPSAWYNQQQPDSHEHVEAEHRVNEQKLWRQQQDQQERRRREIEQANMEAEDATRFGGY